MDDVVQVPLWEGETMPPLTHIHQAPAFSPSGTVAGSSQMILLKRRLKCQRSMPPDREGKAKPENRSCTFSIC